MISYTNVKEKAVFDDNESQAISIIQQARDLSLANLQTNDTDTDYYRLTISTESITLIAYDADGGTETVANVTFNPGITSDTEFYADYTPPYGEISISTGDQSKSFTLSDSGSNSSTISISVFGGFPDAT